MSSEPCTLLSGYLDIGHAVLNKGVSEYLLIKLDEIRKDYPEIEYIERNLQPDHLHVEISFPPKNSIAKDVEIMKWNPEGA